MSARALKGIGQVVALVSVVPAAANAQAPETEEVRVRGTVIGLDGKVRAGQAGSGHRRCAQVRAYNGKLYMPVGGGMHRQPHNPRPRDCAEQSVTVSGREYRAGGSVSLVIESIRRS